MLGLASVHSWNRLESLSRIIWPLIIRMSSAPCCEKVSHHCFRARQLHWGGRVRTKRAWYLHDASWTFHSAVCVTSMFLYSNSLIFFFCECVASQPCHSIMKHSIFYSHLRPGLSPHGLENWNQVKYEPFGISYLLQCTRFPLSCHGSNHHRRLAGRMLQDGNLQWFLPSVLFLLSSETTGVTSHS